MWQAKLGNVSASREGALYDSLAFRMPDLYTSSMEERQRLRISFEEYVRDYIDKATLEREMQKKPYDGVSCFDPALAEVIYRWFTPGPEANVFDCFAGDITKGYVACKCGHNFTGIELRKEQVKFNEEKAAELNVPAKYIQDDGRNVIEHLGYATQDLLITCPPYYDLEIYSDMDGDASVRPTYREFMDIISAAFTRSIFCLKKNRFAVVIVSDVRSKDGAYTCFPEDVIGVFHKCGCLLWNDIVYLNNDGHAKLRAGQYMNRRKVVRMHQRVLVFYNGRPGAITKYFDKITSNAEDYD